MISFNLTDLLILIAIASVIPVSWIKAAGIIPWTVQTLAILLFTGLIFLWYRRSRRKLVLLLLPVVFCITTLLTNILLANVWNCAF